VLDFLDELDGSKSRYQREIRAKMAFSMVATTNISRLAAPIENRVLRIAVNLIRAAQGVRSIQQMVPKESHTVLTHNATEKYR
jgi:hypothetical protein